MASCSAVTIAGMPTPTDLTELERRILGELLSEAATEYEGHTSNDYELPASDANRALAKRIGDDRGVDVPERSGSLFVFDFALMRFLGDACASGRSLDPVELSALEGLLASLAEDEFGLYEPGTPEGMYPLAKGKEHLAFAKRVVARAGGELARGEDGSIEIPMVSLFRYLGPRCGKAAAKGGSAAVSGIQSGSGASISRPGISPRWQKQLKTNLNNAAKWMEIYEDRTREALSNYARGAERLLQAEMFGSLQQARWEAALVKRREVDSAAAANAFEAHWLEQHRALRMLHQRSLAGPITQSMWSPVTICYAAFGLVATEQSEAARQLARLQIEGARRGWHGTIGKSGPSTRFMVHLFADTLGMARVEVRGDLEDLQRDEVACDPFFDQLLVTWRDPDPARVGPLLVAACDAHTHHAFNGADGFRREYASLAFVRTPIAALLVLRLREELGLANPRIDHPMMQDMQPLLDARRQRVDPAPELQAVRRKLEADGLDPRAVREALGAA
jgi:hypothetical protein